MLSDSDLSTALAKQQDSSVPVFVVDSQPVVRSGLYSEIVSWQQSPEGRSFNGIRVAVRVGSDSAAVLALLRLAGWCEAMLLLPQGISSEEERRLMELARVDSSYVDWQESRSGVMNPATSALPEASAMPLTHESVSSPLQPFGKSQASEQDSPKSFDTEWIIPTSGTTGTPKLYAHHLSSLSKSTKQNQQVGQQLAWGLLYDPFRFAGIQVVLQALLGGSTLVLAKRRNELADSIEDFVRAKVNAISATPTLFRKLLTFPAADRLSLRQLTLGGEVADQAILTALRKRYPESKVVHIYAATEAGVGFSVTDGLAGFPADYVDSGTPTGCELAVDDSGELLLKMSGRAPQLLGQLASGDWVSTGDCVERVDDRYFFLGRKNGSINVGGNKVMPEQIEAVIRELADVVDVKVMGRANPITGQIVQAMVVPVSESLDQQILKQQILENCQKSLEPYQVPGIIQFVDELQLTSSGKVCRSKQPIRKTAEPQGNSD